MIAFLCVISIVIGIFLSCLPLATGKLKGLVFFTSWVLLVWPVVYFIPGLQKRMNISGDSPLITLSLAAAIGWPLLVWYLAPVLWREYSKMGLYEEADEDKEEGVTDLTGEKAELAAKMLAASVKPILEKSNTKEEAAQEMVESGLCADYDSAKRIIELLTNEDGQQNEDGA